MATRAQRRDQRKARAQNKRATDAIVKIANRIVKRAISETARYSALHRLHSKGKISYGQWYAGLVLQQDELGSRDTRDSDLEHIRVNSTGRPTMRLDNQVHRLQALRAALKALTDAGRLPLNITCGVCIGDSDLSRIAKTLETDEAALLPELRAGLDALQAHYEVAQRR